MVLITGGTGFIASRIASGLIARGESVVCFDLRPDTRRLGALAEHARLKIVEGDIARLGDLIDAVQQHGVSRIIHTAAVLTGTCQANPQTAVRINIVGTTNVFEAARLAQVARVVYASSMVVHGSQWDHGDGTLDEDARLAPRTFYAHTKIINEATAAAYSARFGLDCRGLRIAGPFGPGGQMGRPGAEVTRLLTLAAMGQPVVVQLARGESPPSTYVDDIAEILVRLSFSSTLTRPVYLCSVSTSAIEDIVDTVRRLLPNSAITFGENGARVTLPYRINAGRLESDIDYRLPALEVRMREHINSVRSAHGLPDVGK
jgi:UDP-glucose 4-epimerase